MIRKFTFEQTQIEGLIKIKPFCATDNRGSFTKDYAREIFEANGISHALAEVFYTSSYKGVIRALHFQRERQQAKLVRCICGHVYDVVVDLRRGSPTFQQWLSFDLDADEQRELFIPGGCAHGYLVLEDSVVSYKCGERFYDEYDDGIVWNDKELGIVWPLEKIGGPQNVILSDKDQHLQTFGQFLELYGGLL